MTATFKPWSNDLAGGWRWVPKFPTLSSGGRLSAEPPGPEHPERRDLDRRSGPEARPHRGEVEEWRDRFLVGAENALRSRPRDEDALKDEQIKKLKQKIGDLVLDNDILKEAMKLRPFDGRTSED